MSVECSTPYFSYFYFINETVPVKRWYVTVGGLVGFEN